VTQGKYNRPTGPRGVRFGREQVEEDDQALPLSNDCPNRLEMFPKLQKARDEIHIEQPAGTIFDVYILRTPCFRTLLFERKPHAARFGC
jgi:hypothetical protein